ncbi:hypothetical protein HQQ80_19015 [Microbacteriaceae bacterium VKM Ac-2855]|nr:hypothetical protein [Microbacteriaceae bacterium VKM Ac-2855]
MALDTDHGSLLRRGGTARFIRWIQTRDGWFPEILHGRYQGHSSNAWVVLVDNDTHHLPDDVWAVYR